MGRQTSAVEFNNFVGGLVTEATPLNFPDNASLDEDNFVLDTDGSRRRRLGMDFEESHRIVSTGVVPPVDGEVTVTSTKWKNAGGDPLKNLIVVQVGNELRVFDMDITPLSAGLIYTKVFTGLPQDSYFSYAVVDGVLIVATGLKEISQLKYLNGVVNYKALTLLVRDLFGVEDVVGSDNLRQGSGITIRPTAVTDTHIYNLRNQTFASPRLPFDEDSVADPINTFKLEAGGKFPSNSDSVVFSLFANTKKEADPVVVRFKPSELIKNPIGTFPAPRGYFIIDALTRGTSRMSEYAKLRTANPSLGFALGSLPVDSTVGGASVVAEYAGRVWYSGFSGETVGGDESSPRMASYLLFSQLVEDSSDIISCYQEGDPTSTETPDLLDSDGGFLRIEGAYGIVAMVSVGTTLMVVANNGVWSVQGGSDYGFKATNYLVSKISNHGCDAPGSVVVIDNTLMFWGDDGIYNVAPNQFGEYIATNTTERTIQNFYDSIEGLDRKKAKGIYDSYERKVKWVYKNRFNSLGSPRELVLDVALGAYSPSTIATLNGNRLPMVASGVQVPPFKLSKIDDEVVVNGNIVTSNTVVVSVESMISQPTSKETIYVVVTSKSPTVSFSFSLYKNQDFADWSSVDGVGADAKAYMLTGWLGGGDFQRNKQTPYVTFHFNKTEDGFVVDNLGDFVPTHQSSCKVSTQWEWSNSINSGRWGPSFQAYRFKRHYMPSSISDKFDNGFSTTVTRNKLRGKGKVLSLLMETEPKKDCHLLGWSMLLGVSDSV
jgi:hypothetical protein